jgi:chromosome condensin MukBEF ATPase and DNA-binding subunit MukB
MMLCMPVTIAISNRIRTYVPIDIAILFVLHNRRKNLRETRNTLQAIRLTEKQSERFVVPQCITPATNGYTADSVLTTTSGTVGAVPHQVYLWQRYTYFSVVSQNLF